MQSQSLFSYAYVQKDAAHGALQAQVINFGWGKCIFFLLCTGLGTAVWEPTKTQRWYPWDDSSCLTLQFTSLGDGVCWHIGSGPWKAGHLAASQTGPGTSKELDLVLSYDLLDLTLHRMWFLRYKAVASAAIPEPQLGCDLCIKIGPDILCFIIFNQRLNAALWGQRCIDSGKLFTVLFWIFSKNQTSGRKDRSKIPASISPTDLKPHTQLISCVAFHTKKNEWVILVIVIELPEGKAASTYLVHYHFSHG